MAESNWAGMGKMTIEGAAKYGHIRKDLTETRTDRTSRLQHVIRRILQIASIELTPTADPEKK